jgi:hypothetical protein
MGYQFNLAQDSMPTSFAATLSNNLMNGVNAILSDPNIQPEDQKVAITNLVNYANTQAQWASTFYGSTVPNFSVPTA